MSVLVWVFNPVPAVWQHDTRQVRLLASIFVIYSHEPPNVAVFYWYVNALWMRLKVSSDRRFQCWNEGRPGSNQSESFITLSKGWKLQCSCHVTALGPMPSDVAPAQTENKSGKTASLSYMNRRHQHIQWLNYRTEAWEILYK